MLGEGAVKRHAFSLFSFYLFSINDLSYYFLVKSARTDQHNSLYLQLIFTGQLPDSGYSHANLSQGPIRDPRVASMNDRSNTALVALRRILRVTELNSRKLAHESELTTSQLLVLQHVSQQGRALPSEIAKSVALKQATVTVVVNKLEDAGLVTRRRDTDDRRRVWIELTDAGVAALESSPDLLQHRFVQGFESLEDWEQSMIIAALERVSALLDAEKVDAAPVLDVGDLDRLVLEQEQQNDKH